MSRANRVRRATKQKQRSDRLRAQRRTETGHGQTGQAPEPDELIVTVLRHIGCGEHDECRAASEQIMGVLAVEQDEAWVQEVDLALLRLHLDVLANKCWPDGWQPADLVRVAVRELGSGGRAAMIDLVAAQLRTYAPSTVDEVWHDQVAELDARVWWSEDAGYVRELAAVRGLDRAQVLDLLVRLLELLAGLPRLEVLTALPGQARSTPHRGADGRGTAGGEADEKLLSRVRALLAKAESTTFEAEAETFTAAAQAMMARHSIDEALLWRREGHDQAQPGGIRLGVDNPYPEPKALLLQQIAEANRCRAVWSRHLGFTTVLGYRSETAWVELLYTSLLVQATTAMTKAGPKNTARGTSRTRAFRASFLESFALRIGERLRETTEQAEAEAADGAGRDLLPVLSDRSAAVDEAVSRIFPDMTATASRSWWNRDREGWASGRGAADLADLARAQTLGSRPA